MATACIEFRKAFCSHRLVEVAAELAKVLHSSTLPRVKRGGSAFVDDPFGGVGCIFIFLVNVQLDVASFFMEKWENNQVTPQCSSCERKYVVCHFCRKVPWVTPPPWRPSR